LAELSDIKPLPGGNYQASSEFAGLGATLPPDLAANLSSAYGQKYGSLRGTEFDTTHVRELAESNKPLTPTPYVLPSTPVPGAVAKTTTAGPPPIPGEPTLRRAAGDRRPAATVVADPNGGLNPFLSRSGSTIPQERPTPGTKRWQAEQEWKAEHPAATAISAANARGRTLSGGKETAGSSKIEALLAQAVASLQAIERKPGLS
jgi:hypothetical protein